jgi:hypothetical protein
MWNRFYRLKAGPIFLRQLPRQCRDSLLPIFRPCLAKDISVDTVADLPVSAAQCQDRVGCPDGPEHSRLFETRALSYTVRWWRLRSISSDFGFGDAIASLCCGTKVRNSLTEEDSCAGGLGIALVPSRPVLGPDSNIFGK